MFDQTSERPIAYASRTLNKNGLNYSQIDKEGASQIFALEKFSQYLLGNHFILTTDNSIKTHYNKQNELTIKDGVILWGLRVIVAEQLRNKVLKELHQNHPGISWMKSLSRIHIWFPNTDNEIENIVNTCQCCKKVSNEPNKSQPHPWDWPTHPMDPVHIDYFNYNKNYFLIMLDSYSK